MKIYVDAMGGDLAPEAPVKGALRALRQYPNLEIILAGRLDEVKPFLGDYEDVKDRLILEEEPEVITNHESPVTIRQSVLFSAQTKIMSAPSMHWAVSPIRFLLPHIHTSFRTKQS